MGKMIRFVTDCNTRDTSIKSNPTFPSCYWTGGVFNFSGYCTMNRNLIRNLVGLGTNVKLYTYVDSIDVSSEEAKWFADHGHCDIPLKSPLVFGCVTSGEAPGMTIHYTMSEMEDRVNSKFLDTLSHDDEIWVPSEWNKNVFLNSGVKTPIRVMPLGVDPQMYHRGCGVNHACYLGGRKKFMFLATSSWNWRKGWDVLIKAYTRAFNASDDVTLMILTRDGEGKGNVEKELPEMVKSLCKYSSPPHIAFSTGKISDDCMHIVYSSADAFVLFPRGEGWCLPYCEAAACGVPIVGSYHSGQTEFLKESDSNLVRPDRIVPVDKSMSSWSNIYDDTVFADYSEKAIDEAAYKMRLVYENREAEKDKAQLCKKRIVTDFSWNVSAKRVYNRIAELQV